MVRVKKPASAIKAPTRAKPTTEQSETDDYTSLADDQRKTKATGGKLRKPSGTQRSSKQPAKPTTQQSDSDDPPSVADDRRKTKASGGRLRKVPGTQRLWKKPAPKPRQKTTDADADGDASDEDEDDEDEDDGGNDSDDGNDQIGDNEDEVNDEEDHGDQENNQEEANTDQANNQKESNQNQANNVQANNASEANAEKEDPYKRKETQMLIAKTKLLLLSQRKKKDGSLRPEAVRSERRLTSEVQELRAWLANQTAQQPEPASDDTTVDPSKKLWAIHGIIKETAYHYLVVWKGEDDHGQPWDDWWVAKREVNAAAKRDWAELKSEVAADTKKKKKKKEWEELEKARVKARMRVSSKGRGGGHGRDRAEDEDEGDDREEGDDEDDDEDGGE